MYVDPSGNKVISEILTGWKATWKIVKMAGQLGIDGIGVAAIGAAIVTVIMYTINDGGFCYEIHTLVNLMVVESLKK